MWCINYANAKTISTVFQESTSVYREMRSGLSEPSPSSHMSRSAKGTSSSSADLTFASAFSSMEYNIRVGSGLATVQSAREPVSSDQFKLVGDPTEL